MKLDVISTDKAPAAIGPYSQGISANGLIFVSGQLGIDPATGQLVGPGFGDQARQALRNLQQVLKAAGSDLDQVVAVDVFLQDMGQFSEFNTLYAEFFTSHRPARAVVEVSALPKAALLEIKCVASR